MISSFHYFIISSQENLKYLNFSAGPNDQPADSARIAFPDGAAIRFFGDQGLKLQCLQHKLECLFHERFPVSAAATGREHSTASDQKQGVGNASNVSMFQSFMTPKLYACQISCDRLSDDSIQHFL